jgi:beta-lactamase regulating signal transducer with metallopeptidase domain
MTSWLVQNAVFVVPLAACIAVVCTMLRPRPSVCHALWLVVLFKLLMPPLPVWRSAWLDRLVARNTSVALQPAKHDAPSSAPQFAAPNSIARARVMDVFVVQPQDASAIQDRVSAAPLAGPPNDSPSPIGPDAPVGDREHRAIDTAAVLAWTQPTLLSIWIGGVVLAAICHVRRAARLRRMLRSSALAPPSFCAEVALQCAKLRVRVPQVRLCSGLPCPMVLALPRSMLLWPANLEGRLDAAAARAVLLHELAHLKRRDHLTAWLEVIVMCLWWWHPIVWWARRELRAYAELACDAWVIAQLPNERSRYAKALVDVCEFISLAKPATAPAVGMSRGNRRTFERRLHMILRQRIAARTPHVAWIAVLAVALLVLPGFSTGQDSTTGETPVPSRTSAAPAGSTGTDRSDLVAAPPENTAPARAADPNGSTENIAGEDASPPIISAKARRSENPPPTAADALADSGLSEVVRELQQWIQAKRGKGRSLDSAERAKIREVLSEVADFMRKRGATDDAVVAEMYLQILGRRPQPEELSIGRHSLRANDLSVRKIVDTLTKDAEFADGPRQRAVASATTPSMAPSRGTTDIAGAPYVGKRAKTQTLLRVVYDMPRDKSEALARFLKEQVEVGQVDVRIAETGLVVTAHANVQRTIVGIVSLMLGEPITLDLGDMPPIGYPMNPTVYSQSGTYGPPTYYAPTTTAQSAPPGVYLPAGPQSGRTIVPRTVVDSETGTRRTVYEERVYDGAQRSDDPSTPRLNPSSTEEAKNPATTKDAPPRP